MTKREVIEEEYPEVMLVDGYDEAIVGIAERFGMEPIVVYDKDKIIKALMGEGLTEEEALEHFDFNIIGAWVGDRTPAFITVHGE